MSRTPVTAVFDIGKTNKKFFLFDENLKEVYHTYTRMEAIPDEDGFPSEPILPMRDWMLETFKNALASTEFEIKKLNFSGHGASFVHTDETGEPVTPLYDYLKPFPEDLLERFYTENGGKMSFCQQTSSPPLAMLNSGLQIYFLKYAKPEKFKNVKHCLHLPQYLSLIFTGQMVSDYTSIGCHTGLWDFSKMDYHEWLKREGIEPLLPPILPGNSLLQTKSELGSIPCGIGVHDSSGALLPYLEQEKQPFALLSTGTWAISINPFNKTPLTESELYQDCLQFLSISGEPIKISRLFIGEEHKYQVEQMYSHWNLPLGTYKKLQFDRSIYQRVADSKVKKIGFHYLKPQDYGLEKADSSDWNQFSDFTEAYYTFIHELTDIQVASLSLVLNDTQVNRVFVDGGFNANSIFLEMLRIKLPGKEIIPSDFPNGSALGAAMLVNMLS
ncbi:sugar (pentulose or hexulose) kinase [Algoriphagus boseongensis]|uniref:Sugar (Pentulose or hexulose) kinase n=1 Tax=Algoriphagus boseongensis TaxID=1442587 RepID=A0A4V3D1X9_9BACT|nr:FGGY family carbohydrate kinase [Algoriphagus boseongensis]TDQ15109.1 sugar (pentulose or hexulose) kinase [Algoriphagus boseongensis]